MLADFENFCKMRMGLRPKDSWLLSYRFENLHREADRSTRYYLNHCVSLHMWLVACRYNRPSTLDLCVFNEGELVEAESINRVRLAEQSGVAINTGVYTASFWKKKQGQSYEDIKWIIEIAPVVDELAKHSGTLSEFIGKLRSIDRIGSFMATQWGLNLSYWYTHLVIDEVPFNNGAKRGLALVGCTVPELLDMEFARDCALTVVALEHSLCCFQKYIKLKQSGKKVVRPYKPNSAPLLPIKLPSNWVAHYNSFLKCGFPHPGVNV